MVDVDIEIPSVDIVIANQLGLIGFLDRRFHGVALSNVFAAQVDITFVGTHRAARHHAAFDEEVRIMPHDLAVLAGAGF